ncbi:RepB family protein [Xenorhabdus sp. SGI240]|uniref:RepB family protein n=1 Tax=Xenorhabdus sp. SGI240 TaxID=3158262 RepID=UPI0032B7AC46
MSQASTAAASSKRPYRKGKPLTGSEKQQAFVARRKAANDKTIRVYVSNELKLKLQKMCEVEGISQGEMISRLIEKASTDHSMNDVTS